MKTPLTLTAKIWNFCQLACPYCASGSNLSRWKPTREPLPNELLNVERLVQWVHCFTPGAVVHVSGGEPLLWDGIETAVKLLIENDIPTVITTNGLLISKRPALLELPLKWIVTHHRGAPFELWRRNALLIRNKPHLACRLVGHGEAVDPAIRTLYSDFNFAFSDIDGLRRIDWKPRPMDLNCVASNTIHLIEPDGRVFPCNCKAGPEIGNINLMYYEKELARQKDRQSFQCVKGCVCAAYQSAVLTDSMI